MILKIQPYIRNHIFKVKITFLTSLAQSWWTWCWMTRPLLHISDVTPTTFSYILATFPWTGDSLHFPSLTFPKGKKTATDTFVANITEWEKKKVIPCFVTGADSLSSFKTAGCSQCELWHCWCHSEQGQEDIRPFVLFPWCCMFKNLKNQKSLSRLEEAQAIINVCLLQFGRPFEKKQQTTLRYVILTQNVRWEWSRNHAIILRKPWIIWGKLLLRCLFECFSVSRYHFYYCGYN